MWLAAVPRVAPVPSVLAVQWLSGVAPSRTALGLLVAAVVLVGLTGLPYLGTVLLYLWLDPSGSPAEKEPAEPTVSILLPTYDEADIVADKLEGLCSLDYPMDRVEVVVVDSSDDGTAAIVEDFFADREQPALTLVREDERRGAAVAANEGVAAADGEVVVRTDADSTLADDALQVATANLADPDVGAVTGRQSAVLGDSQVEQDYRDALSRLQVLESHLDSTFIFHGPCSAWERELYEPVDADSLADDTEAALRIRRSGHRVVADPEMTFAEAGTSGFRARRQRKDRRAMGLVRLLARQRDALGRYGNYGLLVLPFNWFVMVLSPWLVAADAVLASAAAVALVGPVGLALPAAMVAFIALGSRDALGPLQPIHSVVDSQASLLLAQLKLLAGGGDGTWAVDRDSREVFE